MIRFNIEVVAVFKVVLDERGCESEISAKTDLDAASFNREGNGIERVVLNTERMDFNISKFKCFSGREDFEFRSLA